MRLAAAKTILRDDQRVAAVDSLTGPELLLAAAVAVGGRRTAVHGALARKCWRVLRCRWGGELRYGMLTRNHCKSSSRRNSTLHK